VLFKIPLWISSTVFGLVVGHFLKGVMGPIGALLADVTLMPLLAIVKKHHEWKKNRKVQSYIKHEGAWVPV